MSETQPVKARRGRPATISSADVVETATTIVINEGIDALTVRRIATELGVSVFTAHAHMGSKDALLDDVVARLVLDGSKTIDVSGLSWLEILRLSAVESRRVLLTHPSIIDVMSRRIVALKPGITAIDSLLGLAEADGVSAAFVRAAYEIVQAFVIGVASLETARDPEVESGTLARHADEAAQDQLPRAAAMLRDRAGESRDERFRKQLDLLIAGFAAESHR